MSALGAVHDLLPHRGRMRLLETIVASDAEALRGCARIPAGSPLAGRDGAPGVVAAEIGAQAAAAHEGLARRAGGDPSPAAAGYLVRVRDLRLAAARLPVDRPLDIDVRRVGGTPPLALYEMRLRAGDDDLAHGTIATYSAPRT